MSNKIKKCIAAVLLACLWLLEGGVGAFAASANAALTVTCLQQGTNAPADAVFLYQIYDAKGDPVEVNYSITAADELTSSDYSTTGGLFFLSSGQTAAFLLPAGTYTVVQEEPGSSYTVKYAVDGGTYQVGSTAASPLAADLVNITFCNLYGSAARAANGELQLRYSYSGSGASVDLMVQFTDVDGADTAGNYPYSVISGSGATREGTLKIVTGTSGISSGYINDFAQGDTLLLSGPNDLSYCITPISYTGDMMQITYNNNPQYDGTVSGTFVPGKTDAAEISFTIIAPPLPMLMASVGTSVSGGTVVPDQQYTITCQITNNGMMEAYGVRVRSYLPEHTYFVSAENGGTRGAIAGRQHVTWFMDIPAGATVTFSYTVAVNSCVPASALLSNTFCYEETGLSTAPHINLPQDPMEVVTTTIRTAG